MQTIEVGIGGAGGQAPTPDLEELSEQLEVTREKVVREARELVEVLKTDLPAFVMRQLKERYVGGQAPELSAEQLKALKQEAKAEGERVAAEIIPELERWEIWIEGVETLPSTVEERRSLAGNPAVETKIARVGEALRGLLERYGFDVGDETPRYRLPSWFINGRLAIGLVENYWRSVETFKRLEQEIDAVRAEQARAQRAADWDAA